MNRTCPDCGSYNPPEITRCGCGRQLQKPPAARRFPLYLAVLPLILPAFFMVNAMARFMGSEAAGGAAPKQMAEKSKSSSCVDTYGVTLRNTHEDVASQSPLNKTDPQPRHLSTVLHGMVLNHCAETLSKVSLHIVVRDDQRTSGAGDQEVFELKPGVAQAFERAWIGRVTGWEITANK